jgi:hypothetical protein
VATGEKHLETRSWQTAYRGPRLIHAAARFPLAVRRLCAADPFAAALRRHGIQGPDDLPRGALVASCLLVAIRRVASPSDVPDGDEARFGDFTPGRFVWTLADPRPLRPPIPARGRLGLWEAGPPEG